MNIPLDVVGLITEGDESGMFVRVVDDRANSGGFLIFTAPDEEFEEGFDDWAKDVRELESYFEGPEGWKVEWRVQSK